jgi:hypothetical protein
MSAMLDLLIPAEKMADIVRNEEAMQVPGPLRLFTVSFGPRNAPRIRLECMARSSVAALQQHIGLSAHGERMDVVEVKRG